MFWLWEGYFPPPGHPLSGPPGLLFCQGCSEGGRSAWSLQPLEKDWGSKILSPAGMLGFLPVHSIENSPILADQNGSFFVTHQPFNLLVCQIERWFPTLIPYDRNRYLAGANFEEQITPEKLQLSVHPFPSLLTYHKRSEQVGVFSRNWPVP